MIKVTMLVPKNYNDGSPVDRLYHYNVARWFVNKFGGATVSECSGKYKMADGTIASDNMIAYSVCCEQGGLHDIGKVAKDIAIGLEQECIYIEHHDITMELIKQ
jgi:hypothetical protein